MCRVDAISLSKKGTKTEEEPEEFFHLKHFWQKQHCAAILLLLFHKLHDFFVMRSKHDFARHAGNLPRKATLNYKERNMWIVLGACFYFCLREKSALQLRMLFINASAAACFHSAKIFWMTRLFIAEMRREHLKKELKLFEFFGWAVNIIHYYRIVAKNVILFCSLYSKEKVQVSVPWSNWWLGLQMAHSKK